LRRANEERNILQTIKRRKADWIGYIWRRNCLSKHCIGGKIQGRVDEEGEVSSSSMTSRKRKEIGRSPWRPRFGRGYVPVVRQSMDLLSDSLWTCCQTVYGPVVRQSMDLLSDSPLDNDKLHLFSFTQHSFNPNCYRHVCATCFGMYLGYPQSSQYKILTKVDTEMI